jgi:hypothetical protein
MQCEHFRFHLLEFLFSEAAAVDFSANGASSRGTYNSTSWAGLVGGRRRSHGMKKLTCKHLAEEKSSFENKSNISFRVLI